MSRKIKKDNNSNKMSKKEKRKVKTISILLFGFVLFFFTVVILQVSNISVTHTVRGYNLKDISKEQYTRVVETKAKRGSIYDSNNNVLSQEIMEYKLTAVLNSENKIYDPTVGQYVPYYIKNPEEDSKKIIKILGYEDNPDAVELITSQLSQNPEEVFEVEFGIYGENVSLEEKKALEEENITGLYFEEKPERYYPYGELASYIVGYAKQYEDEDGNIELVGELGIESKLDAYLKGVDGEVIEQNDKQGVPLKSNQIVSDKVDGTDVYLTLDSSIQAMVHDYMKKALEGKKYTTALTVVMDADTGAILGAEKFPTFDSNKKDVVDYQDPYYTMCFEPGSVIKTFVVAATMLEDKWDADKEIPSGIRYNTLWGSSNHIADWLYNDSKSSWGNISYAQGLYLSSNVAMTYLLDEIGYDTWVNYASEVFEFGKPVENELFSSESCTYNPQYPFDKAVTSFGQGMNANVMQLLRAYTVFSGDGNMVNPYLVQSIKDSDTGEEIYNGQKDIPSYWEEDNENIKYNEETEQYYKEVMSKKQNKEILELMEGVTYYNEGGYFQGTGYPYGEKTKYKIATKTGTSEVAVDGSYDNDNLTHSVVALAPSDDPEIIVYSAVFNPSDSYPQSYMSEYMGEIIDNTLDYLFSKNEKSEIEVENSNSISLNSYIGKKITEANEELKDKKLNVISLGTGEVKYQYPTEYSKINKEQSVYLIGQKNILDDLKGLSKSEIRNVCYITEENCKINGKGDVQSVTKEDEKYTIELG